MDIEKLDPNFASKDADGKFLWYDARDLGVEGRGWSDVESFYDRLPAKAKAIVRESVWQLSRHSAGIFVRFVTDSAKVGARWTLLNPGARMNHMADTGMSGVDLYVRSQGRFRWLATGRPDGATCSTTLIDLAARPRHCMLYLPLYNGVTEVKIGVLGEASIARAPAWPEGVRPIVFYGTSIVQGGCASRPGMAHTSILGRRLDWPAINLGFSGNGPMDLELAPLMGEIDASIYVLDNLPNMSEPMVRERAKPFVLSLRSARPNTPIVLVENIIYQNVLPEMAGNHVAKNQRLREAYHDLLAQGVTNLHYITCEKLMGDDWEGTVDGVHPTDLGFIRMADAMEGFLRPLLPALGGPRFVEM